MHARVLDARTATATAYDAVRERVVDWVQRSPSGNEPYLGNRGFALELTDALPSSVCAFGFAAGTQNLPLGGCTLYLRTLVWDVLAPTNAFGAASASAGLAVPFDPALRGASLYARAYVLDPQGAFAGLAFTGARRLHVGD